MTGPFFERGPVRVECTFAVTVWAQAVMEEHQVLSQVLSILLAYPEIPPEILPPELQVGSPPVALPARVAHAKGEHGRSDFWNAIGSPYKLSFEYAVTVYFVPGLTVARGPRVGTTSVGAAAARRARSARRGAATGPRARSAGGCWRATARPPWRPGCCSTSSAWLAVTQADGRFSFQGLPDGRHAVQARGADGSTADRRDRRSGPAADAAARRDLTSWPPERAAPSRQRLPVCTVIAAHRLSINFPPGGSPGEDTRGSHMPTVFQHPGVYMTEVPPSSRPIEGVATSVAAFVGRTPMGPANLPTRVTSWTEFVRNFGDPNPKIGPFLDDSYMAHAVRGYFLNGGTTCWIVRVEEANFGHVSKALLTSSVDKASPPSRSCRCPGCPRP